jgi:hypothetical protein
MSRPVAIYSDFIETTEVFNETIDIQTASSPGNIDSDIISN